MSEPTKAPLYTASTDGAWGQSKRDTPSRQPYSPEELKDLRIRYWPAALAADHHPADCVVIWTLLDMLEKELGWTI